MKKDIKEKWVQALRSGQYSQATGLLREGNCFCCLGVLCDIIDPKGWVKTDNEYEFVYKKSSRHDLPPANICREISLSSYKCTKLANMNDYAGLSFEVIANFIDKNL